MTMMELHDRMGACIKEIDASPTPEDRETAIEKAQIVVNVAKQMINNGRFILDAEKLEAQIGTLKHSRANDIIG